MVFVSTTTFSSAVVDGRVVTFDQKTFVPRTGLDCKVKLLKAKGQETRTRLEEANRMDKTGKGRTVVIALPELFESDGSMLSLLIVTRLVIVPALGEATVMVTVAVFPTGNDPNAPVIKLPLLTRLPWVVIADFSITPEGSVLVNTTFGAANGPAFVRTMV